MNRSVGRWVEHFREKRKTSPWTRMYHLVMPGMAFKGLTGRRLFVGISQLKRSSSLPVVSMHKTLPVCSTQKQTKINGKTYKLKEEKQNNNPEDASLVDFPIYVILSACLFSHSHRGCAVYCSPHFHLTRTFPEFFMFSFERRDEWGRERE